MNIEEDFARHGQPRHKVRDEMDARDPAANSLSDDQIQKGLEYIEGTLR